MYLLILGFILYLQKTNVHKKRFRRLREKQELLRNVNAFAANMFTVLYHLLLLYHFCSLVLLASAVVAAFEFELNENTQNTLCALN